MSESFDPAVLGALQEHDSQLAQLHHRTSHLPLDAEIAEVDTRIEARESSIAEARLIVARLDTRQNEFEGKIHEVDTKIDSAAKSLYSGSVTATRELQALEADIASLKKHRSDLEDGELELLLEREPLDAQIAAADAEIAELRAQRAVLVGNADDERIALRQTAAGVFEKRGALAAEVPAAVLQKYEHVRKSNKGVGAARLEHGTCMGCRMKLSAVDLDRLRQLPTDVVAQCEECGSILLR